MSRGLGDVYKRQSQLYSCHLSIYRYRWLAKERFPHFPLSSLFNKLERPHISLSLLLAPPSLPLRLPRPCYWSLGPVSSLLAATPVYKLYPYGFVLFQASQPIYIATKEDHPPSPASHYFRFYKLINPIRFIDAYTQFAATTIRHFK